MLQELMRLRAALFKDYKIDFDKLYDRKREIIEKNLYGVDKDRFAVQIACLRLWLSLAIESENPKPLPNLDFKIGCDDSLTAPPPREIQPDMFRVEKVRAYQNKKAEFLRCNDPDLKKNLREEIETLRDDIAVALQHQPPKPNPQRLKLAQDRAEELRKEITRLVRENKKPEAVAKQAQLKKVKKQLDVWERAASVGDANVGFDWAVEFAEIFMPQSGGTWRMDDLHPLLNDFKSQGTLVEHAPTENGGFDIVVANPPYVRADAQFKHIINEKLRQESILDWKVFRAALLKTKFYKTLYEKWDLYLPFLERAYQLLRDGGDMVFIISDAYNGSKYASRSHEFFVREGSIERIDFCTDIPLFKAGVNNTILHLAKVSPNGHQPTRVYRWGQSSDDFELNAKGLPTGLQTKLGTALFRQDGMSGLRALTGMLNLGTLCYVSVGMVIHCDEKKAQGLFKAEDLVSDARDSKHPKPYVEGKDIARWCVQRVRFLEYGTKRAPAMFRRPTFQELHLANERLLAVRMSGKAPIVAFDDQKLFSNHTVIILVPWRYLRGVRNKSIKKTAKYRKEVKGKDKRPIVFREQLEELSTMFESKYLMAVMNSSFAKGFINARRRSKLDIYPDDWKLLPIPPLPLDQQQKFVSLVDRILDEVEENGYPLSADAAFRVQELEREIDEGVAALYSAPPSSTEVEVRASGDAASRPFI